MLQLVNLHQLVAADLEAAARIFRDELDSDQPFIREHCAHLEQFHGKQVRPALLLLSAVACGGVQRAHHTLAAVVEMVHIATLVHDDVLDEADTRRRASTINRLVGNERAVLLGDYLISHAFHLCSSLDTQFASRLIGRTTNTVCEGEMMQVANRGNWSLTEAQYLDIITRKTASLIGACAQLGAHYAGADEVTTRRLHEFGLLVGVAFQIVDDLLDVTGDESTTGKSVGRDVEKGKLTLPLIHALRTAPPPRRAALLELLECEPSDRGRNDREPADRDQRIAELLAANGSIDYASDAARQRIRDAIALLADLPSSEARDGLIAMAEFVTGRRS